MGDEIRVNYFSLGLTCGEHPYAQRGIHVILHPSSFILRDVAAGDPEDDEDEEEEKKKSEEDEDDDDEEEEETWQVGGVVRRDFFTSSF